VARSIPVGSDEFIRERAEITWGDQHGEKVQFPALPHGWPLVDE